MHFLTRPVLITNGTYLIVIWGVGMLELCTTGSRLALSIAYTGKLDCTPKPYRISMNTGPDNNPEGPEDGVQADGSDSRGHDSQQG